MSQHQTIPGYIPRLEKREKGSLWKWPAGSKKAFFFFLIDTELSPTESGKIDTYPPLFLLVTKECWYRLSLGDATTSVVLRTRLNQLVLKQQFFSFLDPFFSKWDSFQNEVQYPLFVLAPNSSRSSTSRRLLEMGIVFWQIRTNHRNSIYNIGNQFPGCWTSQFSHCWSRFSSTRSCW